MFCSFKEGGKGLPEAEFFTSILGTDKNFQGLPAPSLAPSIPCPSCSVSLDLSDKESKTGQREMVSRLRLKAAEPVPSARFAVFWERNAYFLQENYRNIR